MALATVGGICCYEPFGTTRRLLNFLWSVAQKSGSQTSFLIVAHIGRIMLGFMTERAMTILYRDDLNEINWHALKAALAADSFDNGRSPEQLQRSFRNSRAVCIAWSEAQIVGTARVISDGVCNAYLVDLWTTSHFRRKGIAKEMVAHLLGALPGQHVYLQADDDLVEFYRRLGFGEQPVGMSRVVGKWLLNDPC